MPTERDTDIRLPMRDDLRTGSQFPDFELPDLSRKPRKLSEILGRYPGVLHFSRGSFCPKERRMLLNWARELQPELFVNYCSLITVFVGNWLDGIEYRDTLGATWPFLIDKDRSLLYELQMVDTTDKRHGDIYIPYTFVLDHDRTIYKIYNGWWFLGRPTVEELRMDLRALFSRRDDWVYPGTGRPDWHQEKPARHFTTPPGD